MDLRLTYAGPLLGASRTNTRAEHKHAIRRVFNPQLRRFWDMHPLLRNARKNPYPVGAYLGPNYGEENPHLWQHLATLYERNGYNFVPLVREDSYLLCSVRILFLRPDPPGSLIKSGDIDNRLKTIFDALRLPSNKDECPGEPTELEDPFFVLMEDDKLITHVSVETDALLEQVSDEWDENDARLVLSINLKTAYGSGWSMFD
jgi:hypothetical protein